MAWNTEQTRSRLRQAATEEFAARGPAGTTMERIARRAGINKERLYNYFGDKESLFATVLADELAKVAAAVPPESVESGDIGEYAGRAFDYHSAHPELMRLLHWEALAYGDGPVPDEEARARYYRHKVAAFATAQETGTLSGELNAEHLVFLTLAVSAWWFAVPQLARMITEHGEHDPDEHRRRRAAAVTAAQRLAGTDPLAGPDPAARRAQTTDSGADSA
ncbi:TetR family transcriptional regulator [Streptomyces rubiginosohelvolus]